MGGDADRELDPNVPHIDTLFSLLLFLLFCCNSSQCLKIGNQFNFKWSTIRMKLLHSPWRVPTRNLFGIEGSYSRQLADRALSDLGFELGSSNMASIGAFSFLMSHQRTYTYNYKHNYSNSSILLTLYGLFNLLVHHWNQKRILLQPSNCSI